ncbi:MAG: hypothetical protein ACR2LK_15565 [Solirubrobacteraceae bacterium]
MRSLVDLDRDEPMQADTPAGVFRELEDAVLDLANTLPRAVGDAEAIPLMRFLADFRRALADGDVNGAELAAAKVRDVVARLSRRMQKERFEDPRAAFAFIDQALDGQESKDIAGLVGVTPRTLSTWRGGGAVQSRRQRVRVVAELVGLLRTSMTPSGLLMWFEDAADALDGKPPIALLASDDRAAWARLTAYARGGGAQLAA